MGLMAANEESDPSAILNGFWVTLICIYKIRYLLIVDVYQLTKFIVGILEFVN